MPIQPDKFFPPHLASSHFLVRKRIIDTLCQQSSGRRPHIVIEAQAGAGKTTLVKQYLDSLATPSIWYRVDQEDADPVFFLQALAACLTTLFPDSLSAITTRLLAGVAATPFDLSEQLNLLMNDLNAYLKEPFYLVFDDLHHLLHYPQSLSLFKALLASAPARLRFILISRESLTGIQSLALLSNLVRLGKDNLAMDEHEITDFLHNILHLEVTLDEVHRVNRLTEGWIMGVRLVGLQLEQQQLPDHQSPSLQQSEGEQSYLNYFAQEIFRLLSPEIRQSLLRLSLFEEIPVDLAVELTGNPDIGSILEDLVLRNIFLTALTADNTLFCLHHLFRQFLRRRARKELNQATLHCIYTQAGTFYLTHEHPVQAIQCMLLATDYEQLEAILCHCRMSLLTTNRTATLGNLLRHIPKERLHTLGWASFYLALAALNAQPALSLPYLEEALSIFVKKGDAVGELLALSYSISTRITITGNYRGGNTLLERASTLFTHIAQDLDTSTTILVARNMATGYCIFQAEINEALRYASLALTLARKEQSPHFEASLLMVMGYIGIFAGNTSSAKIYIEQVFLFIFHTEIGSFNRLSIRMMLFNFLLFDGDFPNYFRQKQRMLEVFGLDIVRQSIAGPFCYIWEMDIALNRNDTAEVFRLVQEAHSHYPQLTPHLESQILQMQGLALALQGQTQEALAAAKESHRLRTLAGGLYFITLNTILIGTIDCLCGQTERGLDLLSTGIATARQLPNAYLEATGLFHRVNALLAQGNEHAAHQDLKQGMRLLHRNNYHHLWGWTATNMTRSLSLAVVHGDEPDYARTLAADRLHVALLHDGTILPQLELQTLGDFRICRQGACVLDAEALTPQQRELLAMLLAAPQLKLPQESICFAFWPDSPPDTMKIKLDPLLSRLRKLLVQVIPDQEVAYYFSRKKGMVWLAHCRCDAHLFLQGVHQAMNHYHLQEFWQANNIFSSIEPMWHGEFAPGVAGDEQLRAFRDSLTAAFSTMALAWSDLLLRKQRLPDAISVVNKALLYDTLNEHLVARLYRLEGRHSAVHAHRILDRFQNQLRQEGFTDAEIQELIQAVINHPA